MDKPEKLATNRWENIFQWNTPHSNLVIQYKYMQRTISNQLLNIILT